MLPPALIDHEGSSSAAAEWSPPAFLRPGLAQPVAVLGDGVAGAGIRALLAALGAEAVTYDRTGREFTAAAARAHRLVIFSPGFAPTHPWLEQARDAALTCLSELDLASLLWRGRIIAITGTNGKTTLTEFLTQALRTAGQEAYATGNVGHSFSQLVTETKGGVSSAIAVCEVSSFQAETLRYFQAEATLWTNFAEDHLERHFGLEDYFEAKWNLLTRTSSGAVWVGSSVGLFARRYARTLPANALLATEQQFPDPRLTGTVFAHDPQRENFLLAAAWWRHAGLNEEILFAAAHRFRLGRHRLARIAEQAGVIFWNDSKATNFHAVEAALNRFSTPVILIAGGKSKGGDIAAFVQRIAGRVKHLVLIGETSGELAVYATACHVPHTTCVSLADAVRRAAELALSGENVLLSPGFASFDLFRNYEDRGEQFERLALGLSTSVTNLR